MSNINQLTDSEIKLWREIYKLAEDYFAIQAWKFMEEVDIFGVRCPESGNDYFISIMGSLGESFALSAYEGIHALDRFWNIQDHEGSIDPSYILTIPHIMISLDEPGIIEPEQWGIMKKADVNTNKESIPVFRKIIPGFFPQIPDINNLKDIKYILPQTIKEGDKPAYFPSVLLMINERTGKILSLI